MPYSPPRLSPCTRRANEKNERRRQPDRRVGRRHRDDERSGAHHQHRHGQRQTPPVAIGDMPEQPAAERAHQEAHGEDRRRVEQLRRLALGGEERLGEVQSEGGVGVEVEPLDEVARRADEDGLQASRRIGDARLGRGFRESAVRPIIHLSGFSRRAQARVSIERSSSRRCLVCMSIASLIDSICFSMTVLSSPAMLSRAVAFIDASVSRICARPKSRSIC